MPTSASRSRWPPRTRRRRGRPATRSTSSCAPATTTSSTSPRAAGRGRTSSPGWAASADRDVLDGRLGPARGLEVLDDAVQERPDEQEDLTDQVGHLLLELRRDELAQRRDDRDELPELLGEAGVV